MGARPVERDAAIAERHERRVPDHDVVEQVDVEEPPGGERLGRQVEVVRAGRRVATRVVVDEDDARRIRADSVAEELADADEGGGDVALVDGHHLQDDVLRVQEDHAQLLPLQGAHLDHQAVRHVPRSPDGPPAGRPGLGRPATQLERRGQLGRLRRPDPGQAAELQLARPGEAGKPVVAGKRLFGQAQGADAARAGAPDERHQLRGGEARRASPGEPLARAFVGRHLAQAPAAGENGGVAEPAAITRGSFGRSDGGVPEPGQRSPPIPPPSGPGNAAQPTLRPSPRTHRGLAPPLRGPRARPPSIGTPALSRGDPRPRQQEQDERDPVVDGMQGDRRGKRPPAQEDPAEQETDRDADGERDERDAQPGREVAAEHGEDVDEGEEEPGPDDRRPRAGGPGPGGRGEPAEEQLLPEGGHHHGREEVQG